MNKNLNSKKKINRTNKVGKKIKKFDKIEKWSKLEISNKKIKISNHENRKDRKDRKRRKNRKKEKIRKIRKIEEKIEKLNFYIGELWVSSFSSSSSKSCTTMWRLYFVSSVVTKLHFAHANFGSWVCCFFFREILKDDFVVALGVSGLDSGRTWDDDELLGVSCEVTPPMPPPLDFISTTLLQRKFVYSTTKNISRILTKNFLL